MLVRSAGKGRRQSSLATSRALVAAAIALGLAILIPFAYGARTSYQHAIAEAERETRNARNALVEHVARTFEVVARALDAVADLRAEIGSGVATAAVHDRLRAIHNGSPALQSLGWTDAAGNRLASSLFRDPPPLNIADQEQFRVHAEQVDAGLYVASATRSVLDGSWIIAVSRRSAEPDGRFAGIVSGIVRPDYFERFFHTLDLGPQGAVMLLRRDGTVLARDPHDERWLGESLAGGTLFGEQLPRGASGTYHAVTRIEGHPRIVSYGTVPGLPLIVAVSMSRADALAPFYDDLEAEAPRVGLAIAVLIAGTWLLALQVRGRERTQAKFRGFLETAPDAVVIADREGRIVLVNARVEELFGYKREALLGQPVEMLIPERFRGAHPGHRARYFETPRPRPMAARLDLCGRRRDGSEFPVEISLSPLETEDGVLVSSAIRDVSARRQGEQARALLAAVVESTEVAIISMALDGTITSWNEGAAKLFGYRADEVVGRPSGVLSVPGHETEEARNEASIREGRHVASHDTQRRAKDGTPIDIALTVSPIRDGAGQVVGASMIARDITGRRRRDAELAAARDRAETARAEADAANRAKSEFLSAMSHELRTPLNAVIGFAQMLEIDRTHSLSDKQQEYCRSIRQGGEHLLSLINEILDLARIEAGSLKLSPERIGVAAALARVEETMLPIARSAGIALEFAAPADLPDIRADDQRLRQVLINLVANAIKYNRSGGSVRVSAARASERRVRIGVADTGIGIAAEHQPKLFQPFQRLGNAYTSADGTGIGLSISKRLVEAMGGEIGFATEVGSGSTFWIELPIASEADSAQFPPGVVHELAAPRAMAGGYSLLYVEDNPANLRLMEHLVSTLPDVAMLSATTPALGLDLARTHRPDVIVLDLNLPEISGVELLRRLKIAPETASIPVLALTASARPHDVERGLAAGFFRYLTKPIDVKAFLVAIDDALAGAPQRRAGAS